MAGYRTKVQIVGDILACAGNGASVSEMVRRTNTSHNRLSTILGILVSQGLMEQDDNGCGRRYQTSAKGRDFLQEYQTFQKFSENYGMVI